MVLLLMPVVAVLAGLGAALIFRSQPAAAAAGAAGIPIALFYMFAVYRSGPEILPHPGLWMLALTWALFVIAGYGVARMLTRSR